MSDSSDYLKCQVCESYEICLITEGTGDESGLYCCKKGHVFCKDCYPEFQESVEAMYNDPIAIRKEIKTWAIKPDNYDELSDEEIVEQAKDEGWLSDLLAEVPEYLCPMCKSHFVSNEEMLEYFLKKSGKTREEIAKEMHK